MPRLVGPRDPFNQFARFGRTTAGRRSKHDAAVAGLRVQLRPKACVHRRRDPIRPSEIHSTCQLAMVLDECVIRTVAECHRSARLVKLRFEACSTEGVHHGGHESTPTRARPRVLPNFNPEVCPPLPGDICYSLGAQRAPESPEPFRKDIRRAVVVSGRERDRCFAIRSSIELGRTPSSRAASAAAAPVLGFEKSSRHETVQMEGSELAADAELRGCFVAADRHAARDDELEHATAVRLVEQSDRSDRIGHGPFVGHAHTLSETQIMNRLDKAPPACNSNRGCQ